MAHQPHVLTARLPRIRRLSTTESTMVPA